MMTRWLGKIHEASTLGLCARSTGSRLGWKLYCKAHGAPFVICPPVLDLGILREAHTLP